MAAQRAIHGERDAGAPLDRPRGDGRRRARQRVAHRVAPTGVESGTTGGAVPGGDAAEQQASIVAPEVVGALAQAERDAAEIVVPAYREPGAHQPVAPRPLAERIVHADLPRRTSHDCTPFPVVEHVPVVGQETRVERQATRLAGGRELHALDLGLARRAGVDRITACVADLDRHPAVPSALDGNRRAPPPVRKPMPLDPPQPVVDQHRGVQPLAE